MVSQVKKITSTVAAICSALAFSFANAGTKYETEAAMPFGAFVPATDPFSRNQVLLNYWHYMYVPGTFEEDSFGKRNYVPIKDFPISQEFTGDVSACNAGNTNPAWQQAAIRQVNYGRTLAGLSNVRLSQADDQRKAQLSALIVGANVNASGLSALSHAPSSTAACYTADGAQGSSHSNLSYVGYGGLITPRNMDGYFDDDGDNNASVGHRRWFLYPAQSSMAFGNVNYHNTEFNQTFGASAVWIGNNPIMGKPAPAVYTNPEIVTWPPKGYVPYLIMPQSNRWSISCHGCDFKNSTVEFSKDGILQASAMYEPIINGAGDNTLVFKPNGYILLNPDGSVRELGEDETYEVTVHNVKTAVGTIKDYSYRVIVFNPQRTNGFIVPRYNATDMWWAGEIENGWGMAVTQGISGQLFVAWFTYDEEGKPLWATVSGGTWIDETTFNGTVYTVTGTPFSELPFDATKTKVTPAGSMTLHYTSPKTAIVEYTLNGVSRIKQMSRLNFGPAQISDGQNYSGMWWNKNESGWGFTINQQYQTIFGTAFVYDANGKPTWFVLPGCQWDTPQKICTGSIYTTTGSPLSAVYSASQFVVTPAGTAAIDFIDDYNATLSYTLNGVTISKSITRMAF